MFRRLANAVPPAASFHCKRGYVTNSGKPPNPPSTLFFKNACGKDALQSADGRLNVKYNYETYPDDEPMLTVHDTHTGQEYYLEAFPRTWDIQEKPSEPESKKGLFK